MLNISKEKQEKYFAISFVLSFAIYFVFLSLHVHWSDSEIWAISLAKKFLASDNPSVDYKIVFNALLKFVYSFSFDNRGVIDHSRILFAGLGLTLLFQTRYCVQTTTRDKRTGFLALFFLACTTLFISQGFKVRSDVLASVLQLFGIAYFLRMDKLKKPSDKISALEVLAAIGINMLLLLSTPKAVYNLGVNFVFIFAILFQKRKSLWIKSYLIWTFLVPLVLFLIIAAIKNHEFLSAVDFLIASYAESPQHPFFLSLPAFEFVFDAFIRNLPIFILVGISLAGWKKLKNDVILFPYAIATLASFAVILVHNDRLPFFLLGQMIFPSMLAAMVFADLKVKWLRVAIGSFAFLSTLYFSIVMLQEANNREQIQAQRRMEEYLKRHGDPLYYDATAALPLSNKILMFPSPQHKGNEIDVLNVLKEPNLSLVFFGNRLFNYLNSFYLAMEEKFFIQIGPGVFARSYAVRSTHDFTAQELLELCNTLGGPPRLYVYEGSNFLEMRVMNSVPLSCPLRVKPDVHSVQPFIAFSAFDPLNFDGGLNFSQIFDHRPYF